jgi:SAM-dependent methyltransferase
MKCRHCQTELNNLVIDLGHAPPSNAYLEVADLALPEVTYPLRVHVCSKCFLVQTEDYASAGELFTKDYAYFSSTSRGWLEHARTYARQIRHRLGLSHKSLVIEVASNDGYLLRNFVEAEIPCLGIEPTDSTAEAAEKLGIPVLRKFFGAKLAVDLAREGKQADLVCGNNVYAHVPDINDFTTGLATVLKPDGVVTLEFPHLLNLVQFCQFDTIYHEHYSYLSLGAVRRIFAAAGLRVFDVEELPTHGGSLRVYGCLTMAYHSETPAVASMIARELSGGLEDLRTYGDFQNRANRIKDDFVSYLIEAKRKSQTVAGYGAAAKGNTLLNYAGVKPDLLPYVCDAAAAKQGKFLPGSHIPILAPSAISQHKPDVVVILPWNIAAEVRSKLQLLTSRPFNTVTFIPRLMES